METEKIIHELETFIDSIPNELEVFVSFTNIPEDEAKAYCDLPHYWVYKTLTSNDKARAVSMYFTRKGIKYKFINTQLFDHANNVLIYAIPKKKEMKDPRNFFQRLFGYK